MKQLIFNPLSSQQTQICKGLAIIFIVIHNVMSKMTSAPRYNEMYFRPEHIWDALHTLYIEPSQFMVVMMTFWGHYAVQVFIFLSAYGLVRSSITQPSSTFAFILKRIKHLLVPMLAVMLFYLSLDHYFSGLFSLRSGTYDFVDVLKRMLFVSNFFPGEAFLVIGPWWFLSMIMQFYCLFLPLRTLQLRYGNESLAVLSLLAILIMIPLEPLLWQHQFTLTFTVLGHLPEFALGMVIATLDRISVPVGLIVLAGIGLLLGNLVYVFWFFAPICAIILIMTLCGLLLKYLPPTHRGAKILEYLGLLSLYIFLLHGVLREPFVLLALEVNTAIMSLACALSVLVLTIIFAQGLYYLDKYLKRYIISS